MSGAPAQASVNGNNIPSSISYIDERGGEHTYILNADGSGTRSVAEKPPGEFETLQFNMPASGQHTLQFRNGTKYIFEEIGTPNMLTFKDETARLKYIDDAYGNRLTLTYDTGGRLTRLMRHALQQRAIAKILKSSQGLMRHALREATNETRTAAASNR